MQLSILTIEWSSYHFTLFPLLLYTFPRLYTPPALHLVFRLSPPSLSSVSLSFSSSFASSFSCFSSSFPPKVMRCKVTKRFFRCKSCKWQTTTLGAPLPTHQCRQCGSAEFEKYVQVEYYVGVWCTRVVYRLYQPYLIPDDSKPCLIMLSPYIVHRISYIVCLRCGMLREDLTKKTGDEIMMARGEEHSFSLRN